MVERMDVAKQAEDMDVYYPINLEIHAALLRLAGNARLSEMYVGFIQELHLFRQRSLVTPGGMARSNEEHRAILEALWLRDPEMAASIKPDQVSRIRVGTNRHMPTTLLHHNPTTELQAKFSMQFSMAILVLRRRAGLVDYTDETVNLPEVRGMTNRVDFDVDPTADAAGFDKMTSIVEIHLNDGRVICGQADFGKGSPANPMSWSDVAAKFEDCASYGGLPPARAREVIAMVEDLPALDDIRRLTALLVI